MFQLVPLVVDRGFGIRSVHRVFLMTIGLCAELWYTSDIGDVVYKLWWFSTAAALLLTFTASGLPII